MTGSDAWIIGEALIDLVPDSDGVRIAIVGGGPANTAKALAKLGMKSYFIGGISSDRFGQQIKRELLGNCVDLTLALESDLRTATATVTLDILGSASYEFDLENTATFDFRISWLPKGAPSVLYLGTLGTLIEPGASNIFEWAKAINVPKIYDPNIRPTVLSDRDKYRANFEKWIAISDVVKLSEEDFDWLYGDQLSPGELLEQGPQVVIVTRGERGLSGFHHHDIRDVPGFTVDVVDTVGAGDTVGAILTEAVSSNGVAWLIDNLDAVLSRAARAAAITCSRVGAEPPSLAELEAL